MSFVRLIFLYIQPNVCLETLHETKVCLEMFAIFWHFQFKKLVTLRFLKLEGKMFIYENTYMPKYL